MMLMLITDSDDGGMASEEAQLDKWMEIGKILGSNFRKYISDLPITI